MATEVDDAPQITPVIGRGYKGGPVLDLYGGDDTQSDWVDQRFLGVGAGVPQVSRISSVARVPGVVAYAAVQAWIEAGLVDEVAMRAAEPMLFDLRLGTTPGVIFPLHTVIRKYLPKAQVTVGKHAPVPIIDQRWRVLDTLWRHWTAGNYAGVLTSDMVSGKVAGARSHCSICKRQLAANEIPGAALAGRITCSECRPQTLVRKTRGRQPGSGR